MTDYGNNNQKQAPYTYANVPPRGNETALMIEGLYNGIAYDLQKMKKELMNELKYSAMQSSSVYQSIQKETSSAVETNAQTAQSARAGAQVRVSAESDDLRIALLDPERGRA